MIHGDNGPASAAARLLLIPLLRESPDLTAISDPAAWKLVKEHAGRYGVAQLIAFAVRAHVPPQERAWCDKVLTTSWTRYEMSLAHLDYVLGILDDAGLRSLALKGPALAVRCYQPPFLRKPSLDLDIAIEDENLERAIDALTQAGYRAQNSIQEARACSHHMVLRHPSRSAVELHFRISNGALGSPVAEFLPRARPLQLATGRETLVLAPTDELLQLILHAAQDRFGNLFHLYEVRRMWRAAAPAVREEVMRQAAARHFSGVFALVDIAFRTTWGEAFLPLDAPIRRTWLHWRLDRDLYEAFARSVQPGTINTVKTRLRASLLQFQITDGPADALRFVVFKAAVAWFQLINRRWRPIPKLRQIPLD